MRMTRLAVSTAAILAISLAMTAAADAAVSVTVKGVHLCCGGCIKGVNKTLKDAEGISGLNADKKAKTVSFSADNEKAANAALAKLAKAGFGGKVDAGDNKKIAFPKLDVKKGTKSDNFTISNVHLCCGGCKKSVSKALVDVKGIEGDLKFGKGTVSVSGKDIDVLAVFAALNKGGFSGSLKK